MPAALFIILNTGKEHISIIGPECFAIVFLFDLCNCAFGRMIPFQFHYDGRLAGMILAWQEYKVCKTVSCRHFPHSHIILPRTVIGQIYRIA